MHQIPTESLISLKQLADFLNVTERTIYNMIETKKIPFYRVGGKSGGDYRFNKQDVLESLPKTKLNKM